MDTEQLNETRIHAETIIDEFCETYALKKLEFIDEKLNRFI